MPESLEEVNFGTPVALLKLRSTVRVLESIAKSIWLREIFLEPFNTLLLRFVHGLLVFVAAPITPERETVDLVFINLGKVSR